MKRVPLIVSFLLFIALCAAIAYWALQLFKPPTRPVAAVPRVARTEVSTDAAAALFGGRPSKVAVASNYQLKGVILSGTTRDSVAILSADGKPAQAVSVGLEVVPGVTVKEVHREYVLLSEGGVVKRVELPESAKAQVNLASAAPVGTQGAAPSPPASSRGQMSPPPAPAQATSVPNPATGSTQTANPRSPLLPPPAPQAQQQTPALSQTAPAVPPTVVPAIPVQTPAVPALQQSVGVPTAPTPAAAPSTPTPPAASPRSIPEAAGTASEMLPPPALQSR